MKAKITEQSLLLFEKKGFSNTSIQDIVEALNVTKGTFYYYFTSKEELLMEIHVDYINRLLERQMPILEDKHLACKEKLHKTVHLLISDIQKYGSSGRVFFREMRHLDEKNEEIIREKREEFRLSIENIIKEGMNHGEFRNNLQADMIAFGLLGITNWSYQWYNPAGKVSVDELTNIFIEMIFNGIGQ